ncbi:hypothetical protein [Mastigocladopsis repens]|uniref:hypothetical protein n=1 Tax=Mastigocladopsis repens TaxID=221287 RepID=UPI0012EA66CF|nr:hypothetical protein [Mastigocladopsis repens]
MSITTGIVYKIPFGSILIIIPLVLVAGQAADLRIFDEDLGLILWGIPHSIGC